MLNFLLTALAFVLSTATFTMSYSYSGVARTFTSLGKAVAEVSVSVPQNANGELGKPYFNTATFEKMTKKHFDEGLKRYLGSGKEYSLTYFYFSYSGTTKVATKYKPRGITVTFKCPVSWFGTYENEVTFSIKEGYLDE